MTRMGRSNCDRSDEEDDVMVVTECGTRVEEGLR